MIAQSQKGDATDIFQHVHWQNKFARKKRQQFHPSKRFNHGSFLYKNSLFVVGGANTNPQKPIEGFSIYRLVLDTYEWKQIEQQEVGPESLSSFAYCVYMDRLYIFGGSDILNESNNCVWCFDLTNQQWSRIKTNGQQPEARELSTFGFLQPHYFFIFGGIDLKNNKQHNNSFILNLNTLNWSELQQTGDVFSPRFLEGSCGTGELFYIFGGQRTLQPNPYFKDFYQLSVRVPANKLVIRKIDTKSGPSERSSHSLLPFGDKFLILLGGQANHKKTEEDDLPQDCADAWLYDRRRNNWFRIDSKGGIFKARSNFSAVSNQNKVYIFGGIKNTSILYDDLIILDMDMEALDSRSADRLCWNCKESMANQELITLAEPAEMPFKYVQAMANLIKFPFAAFGLLIDNCVMTGASVVSISILDKDDEEVKMKEAEQIKSSIYSQLKSPDRTLRWIVIEDNGRPWTNDEFLRIMLKFEMANILQQQVSDKKTKAYIHRENMKKQFGNNLKLGSLRLGKAFLYISYLDNFIRVALMIPRSIPNRENLYACYHYIQHLLTNQFITEHGDENKTHIASICRHILKANTLTEVHDKNQVYVFELREIQAREGHCFELNPYNNDFMNGNIFKIKFLQNIGYNLSECPDFSLRSYISLLFLKTQTKISLKIGKNPAQDVINQMYLDRMDRQKQSGLIKEIDYANEYPELAECKVIELYYNPNMDRKSTLFHSGILIYHRNRLIFRFKYELGMIFPMKFYKRRYKRTQNSIFRFFGFIELPDGVPCNFIKTQMQHHILMQVFLSDIKLITKDIKRKLTRDEVDMVKALNPPISTKVQRKEGQEQKRPENKMEEEAPPVVQNVQKKIESIMAVAEVSSNSSSSEEEDQDEQESEDSEYQANVATTHPRMVMQTHIEQPEEKMVIQEPENRQEPIESANHMSVENKTEIVEPRQDMEEESIQPKNLKQIIAKRIGMQ